MEPMIQITLSGPGKNALGSAMMRFLLAELDRANGAPLLLRGDGDAFSAGLNLKEVLALDDATGPAFLRLLEDCMTALYLYRGPTVALINGHAIAGGAVLALCCDIRIAANQSSTKIGLNEVALGLRFPPRILSIVRRRLPPQYVEQVLLGAELYSPQGALGVGLIDAVVDDADALARARLTELGAHPPEAYAATKRDLRGDASGLFPEEEHEARLAELLGPWRSPALHEKIKSVLKR